VPVNSGEGTLQCKIRYPFPDLMLFMHFLLEFYCYHPLAMWHSPCADMYALHHNTLFTPGIHVPSWYTINFHQDTQRATLPSSAR
jgi:hypothetical protein